MHADLPGISLDVTLQAPGARPRFVTTRGFLFTHRSYSGPAVLDESHLAMRSALWGVERQAGDEGYRKAEVTGGGLDLAEVDPNTLESRRHPGLFLCGEMLDAFRPIGGHNFQWAWATGRAAGMAAARRA